MLAVGTKILMSDGTEKSIEQIKVGDKIMTKDYQEETVTKFNQEYFKGELVQYQDIFCTPSQRIFITTSEHYEDIYYDVYVLSKDLESFEGIVYSFDTLQEKSFISGKVKLGV
jgi:hypothetical protein